MQAHTAASFCAVGVALVCIALNSSVARFVTTVLTIFLIILSSLTLLQYLTGHSLGIDQLLSFPNSSADRMAPTTAFCFLVTGMALFMANRSQSPHVTGPLVFALGSTLTLIGGLGVLGFIADVFFGFPWFNYSGLAIHTASAFTLVGAGILLLAHEKWPMRGWAMDRSTTWMFVIALFLLLEAIGLAYYFTSQLKQTGDRFTERQEVLKSLQSLSAQIASLENNQRGFIITGDEFHIQERQEMNESSARLLLELRNLMADNTPQLQRLDQLEKLMIERNAWEERTLAVRRQNADEAMTLIATGQGLQLSRQLRLMLQDLERVEYEHLAVERDAAETSSTMAFLLLPVGGFLTIALLAAALFQLNSGMQQRAEVAGQMQQMTDNLPGLVGRVDLQQRFRFANAAYEKWLGLRTDQVIGRTMAEVLGPKTFAQAEPHVRRALLGEKQEYENEILTSNGRPMSLQVVLIPDFDIADNIQGLLIVAMDVTRRKHAEEQTRLINAELEKRVDDRTAELEATNKELEAFSYSVSHDLRAPLRAVDGFSRAVEEDYGEQLPEEGRRYLSTIRKGAQQMGALIDDLLAFSRLSRLPMNRQNIDMEALARQALMEIGAEESGAEIRIHDLGRAYADSPLLKQVWVNLLSNALKYSRKGKDPLVEIGLRHDGDDTWYVRDNGTGFDMRYAHKLFGVFQRLHRSEEYEGTGVGLALVQRIVHRHGGRVWCEAAIGKGATFYFTLGKHHPDEPKQHS